MIGSQLTTLHGWKQLIEWSIEYSCLTEGERCITKEILQKQWEDSCERIIKEYGWFADKLDLSRYL